MKAAICDKYGPPEVLTIKEVDKPVPRADEMLIRVHASSVNAADCNIRGLTYIPPGLGLMARLMLGFRKPQKSIIGSVFAGVIEETGRDIKTFRKGDAVFGTGAELGAYAEYMCRHEKRAIAVKPENISFGQAAAIPYGALTALYFLRDMAGVKSGQKVLVNGASGGDIQLLAEILKNATGMNLDDFSAKYIFEPMKISTYDWWLIFPSGEIQAAGGLKLTPRDMAKTGVMMLNKGIWNGNRIISENWVDKKF